MLCLVIPIFSATTPGLHFRQAFATKYFSKASQWKVIIYMIKHEHDQINMIVYVTWKFTNKNPADTLSTFQYFI